MDFISRFGARTGMKAGFCVEKPRFISDGVFVMTPGNVRCVLPRSEESLYLPMPRTTAMNPSSPPPACRGHAEHGGRGEKSGCWMKKLFVQQPLFSFPSPLAVLSKKQAHRAQPIPFTARTA